VSESEKRGPRHQRGHGIGGLIPNFRFFCGLIGIHPVWLLAPRLRAVGFFFAPTAGLAHRVSGLETGRCIGPRAFKTLALPPFERF